MSQIQTLLFQRHQMVKAYETVVASTAAEKAALETLVASFNARNKQRDLMHTALLGELDRKITEAPEDEEPDCDADA